MANPGESAQELEIKALLSGRAQSTSGRPGIVPQNGSETSLLTLEEYEDSLLYETRPDNDPRTIHDEINPFEDAHEQVDPPAKAAPGLNDEKLELAKRLGKKHREQRTAAEHDFTCATYHRWWYTKWARHESSVTPSTMLQGDLMGRTLILHEKHRQLVSEAWWINWEAKLAERNADEGWEADVKLWCLARDDLRAAIITSQDIINPFMHEIRARGMSRSEFTAVFGERWFIE